MKTLWAIRALPASALVLIMGLGGCSDTADSLANNCEFKAKIDAVGTAAGKLNATAAKMKFELTSACAKIAGDTPPAEGTEVEDDDVTAACNAAKAAISAQVKGNISLTYVPPRCEVNASAQLSCESKCTVDAKCDPGSVEVRCDPGELSVACDGECSGSVECSASAGATVDCQGTCDATCTGSCGGTCNGECDGKCDAEIMNADGSASCAGKCDGECKGSCSASCEGTCSGTCSAAASAMAECKGEARCKGECKGTATAPKCEGTLTEPSCEVDADCEAGCKGQANLNASCTKPQLIIDGDLDAEFAANLQDNLPVVIQIWSQAKLAADAAVELGDASVNLLADIPKAPTCVAAFTADLRAQLEGSVKAAASINVSVMASASVSGTASSGG